MQVENVIAFAHEPEPAGLEIRVNFGVFAGRDERKELCDRLITLAEIWARQCINERRAEISEL